VRALINGTNWSKDTATLYITITPPFWKTWWFISLSFLFISGSCFAIYSVRINSIKKQKELLEEQVVARTAQLKNANDKVEKLYYEVKDSIRAAQEVQEAILPSPEEIGKYLKDFFVFYRPKDIVSGDFYWFQVKGDKIIIGAADCTGHGVSGALMSVNGYYLLKLAIYECAIPVASEILEKLNEGVGKELKKDESALSGMDISLCVIDLEAKKLDFAGANSPLYVVRKGALMELKGDKYSIGQFSNNKKIKYNNQSIDLEEGDSVFMFSDGIRDQFGGDDGYEKFNSTRLRNLLTEVSNNCDHPANAIEKTLAAWMDKAEQLDDIMVLGFKI
jgi:serine phosphatase RsbU (regulator of sigma subunit)